MSSQSGQPETQSLCLQAREHWAGGRSGYALRDALAARRGDPQDLEAKLLLAGLVAEFPGAVGLDMRAEVLALLRDPDIAPEYICVAGWLLLLRDAGWNAALTQAECRRLAGRLQDDALASALLCEAPVGYGEAERVLTRLRRWLLLSGEWQHHPRLVHDLAVQAELNGGAWPFIDAEREALKQEAAEPLRPAYLPRADVEPAQPADFDDPVTRAVAQNYERWPYPAWRRLMAIEATKRLPDEIRALDPGARETIPLRANVLIAGCGTGSEAAQIAREYPDSAVTAIDVSRASLAYAERQCAAIGVRAVRFLHLDLHRVADLQEPFDAIFCSGVLHHLPDPERGWAALCAVLRPGGAMRIMLYSCLARRALVNARALIADLAAEPVSDDLIRRVRQRLLDRTGDAVATKVVGSNPFATLAGTHDMLLHRREDCFDVPRISRALARLRLRLLTFVISAPDMRARYEAMFPNDRAHRSIENWHLFERQNPDTFISQYAFWCRKDGR
jgi:SAM-dependent methyltransferase